MESSDENLGKFSSTVEFLILSMRGLPARTGFTSTWPPSLGFGCPCVAAAHNREKQSRKSPTTPIPVENRFELLQVTTMGRPQPHSSNRTRSRAKDDDDGSSVTPVIPRRYPRMGSAFQTKVPASVEDCYQPSRQTAVLLSKEFPDVSEADVSDGIMKYRGELSVFRCFILWGEREP